MANSLGSILRKVGDDDTTEVERDGDSTVTGSQAEVKADTFTALYRRYVTPVYRYLYSRVGNHADAEDLAEQVFVEALEGIARYQEQGNFSAWLFTIARRRAVDHYRRQREQLSLEVVLNRPGEGPGPETEVAGREQLEKLAGYLSELDDEKMELLRLRFTVGLGYREIGEIVDKSEGAVRMAVHRLLQQLQAKWTDDDE